MPFNQLKRQDSFPPTIIHLSPHLTAHGSRPPTLTIQDLNSKPLPVIPQQHVQDKDINKDPISFFLTAPSDSQDFGSDEEIDFLLEQEDYPEIFDEDEDLSAGIEGSHEDLLKLKRDAEVREISPSSLQRARVVAQHDNESAILDEVEFGFAMPLSLKEFTSRSVAAIAVRGDDGGKLSRAGYHPETLRLNGLSMNPQPSLSQSQREKNRGRRRVRLSPPLGGNERSSSWSPPRNIGPGRRKPVSWRLPSRGIWTIDEDDEFADESGLSRSAPVASHIRQEPLRPGVGGLKKDDGRKRVVKKVRWADLVGR